MMGTKIRSFSPLPDDLSLEDLVPEDHFYRRLEATLDLSFVRELVRPALRERWQAFGGPGGLLQAPTRDVLRRPALRASAHEGGGRPPFACAGTSATTCSSPCPTILRLTRIRERYGLEVFRRFFERIVEECIEAGLVWGEELFFDATKVEANASIDSTRSRSLGRRAAWRSTWRSIFPEQARPTPTKSAPEPSSPASWEPRRAKTGESSRERTRSGHRWIAGAGRQERGVARWGYRRMADLQGEHHRPRRLARCTKRRRARAGSGT